MICMSVRNQPAQPPKKQQRKQWGGLVFLVSVIFGLVWALVNVLTWMGDEKQLPLSQIVVQGDMQYLNQYDVRDAVNQLGTLQSFMVQDVNDIQKAISALAWVSHVAVRKQWPDTIKVSITEYQPGAIWNTNQLLDVSGNVFNGDPEDVKDLVLISLHGPKGTEGIVLDALQEMRAILSTIGLEIAELSLNERRSWRIMTDNGIRIELGRESRKERLHRFVNLFHEINTTNQDIDYVDLRYDTGAAVGWKEPVTHSENLT